MKKYTRFLPLLIVFFTTGPLHSQPCPAAPDALITLSISSGGIFPGVGDTLYLHSNSLNASAVQWVINHAPYSTAIDTALFLPATGPLWLQLVAFSADTLLCSPDTLTYYFDITCQVKADFGISDQLFRPGETATFTNKSAYASQFEWFLDGVSKGAVFKNHTFLSAGVFAVRLVAGNGYCSAETTRKITVLDSCTDLTYHRCIGTPAYETAKDAGILPNGDYIVSGFRNENPANNGNLTDGFLLRLRPDGTAVWKKIVDFEHLREDIPALAVNPDGTFVFGLEASLPDSNTRQTNFAKFDSDANILWQKRVGSKTLVERIRPTPDGGYFLCGQSAGTGNSGAFCAKLDAGGNTLWSKVFKINNSSSTYSRDVDFTPDGGYIVTGYFYSPPLTTGQDGFILRLNASGGAQWARSVARSTYGDLLNTVRCTNDGGFLLGGEAPRDSVTDHSSDAWLLKVNSAGNLLWSKLYEISDSLEGSVYSFLLQPNGRIVAPTGRNHTGARAALFQTDAAGNLDWGRVYNTLSFDRLRSIAPAPGGFFLPGQCESYGAGSSDAYCIRTDALGYAGLCPEDTIGFTVFSESPTLKTVDVQEFFGPPTAAAPFFNLTDFDGEARIVCTNSCIADEICDNTIDDDGDGLFDCLDPDCSCTPDPCTPKQAETWYFGDHSGLDFSTEPPSVLSQGKTENNAACAVANDVRGHLLFYSDGITVYNRFHQPMPNGSGLASGSSLYRSESVIIPHPGDPGLFYLFTVSPGALDPGYAVARYSLVNMRLDGGRGDLVAGLKSVPLLAPGELVETRLAAVKSCSAERFWLAMRPQPPMSSGILTFRIDSLGLHPAAVFSAFNWPPAGGINQMKFSPDGRRLAVLPITSDAIILFDFDASLSGKCTNPQTIYVAPADGLKGLEFSAGGRFLYVSKRIEFAPPGKSSAIVQYDLEAGDAAAIQASAAVVGQHQIALAGHEHWGMQLASNGKIYISAGFLSGMDQYNPFLHVIHQPDRAGIKCQFEEMGLSLSPAAGANRGLCNFPSSYFSRAYVAFSPLAADTVCVSDSLYPYPLLQAGCMQVDSFQWKLEGLSASLHADSSTARVKYLAQGEGLLTVQAFTPCGVLADTLPIVVTSSQAPPLDLGADQFLCVNDTTALKAPGGFKRYRWQDGSAGPEFAATKAGSYWVEAWDICGVKQTDTIVLTAVPVTVLDLGPDRMQCPAAAVSFTRPAGFVIWHWTPGNFLSCDTCAQVLAAPQASQTYTVVALTAEGCSFTDTLRFTVNDTLFFQMDTSVCSNKRLELFGALLPADTSAQILIAATGPGECDTLWTVDVLGIDTESSAPSFTICPGAYLQFNGLLLPADTVATFIFQGLNGCDSLVTVTTVASPAVTVELPADTVLRLGDTLALISTVSGFGPFLYNWSPGDGLSCPDCPNPLAAPVFTTLFSLQVHDSNGCSGSDSMLVTVDQRCILYAVTAFTPNNDGTNDWFFPKTDPCVRQVLSWRIFNRWGQVVFERKNVAPNMEMLGWDGRVEGKDAASDVYIWLAELEYYNGEVVQQKGQITLLR